MITVVGDGAVGTAAAVALSDTFRVVLAGPPGSPCFSAVHHLTGAMVGSAMLTRQPIDQSSDRASIVVAALKAYDIPSAVPFISAMEPQAVVCLSNGMGLDNLWGELSADVEYAVLTAGFILESRSSLSVKSSAGKLHCGADLAASEIFSGTMIPVHHETDVNELRWAKWYANSIINPLGALTGRPNNQLKQSALGHLIGPLGEELASLMPSDSAISKGKEMLHWLLQNSQNRCSMLQDVSAGRRTEIDFLTGLCVQESRGNCPVARFIVAKIRALEKAES